MVHRAARLFTLGSIAFFAGCGGGDGGAPSAVAALSSAPAIEAPAPLASLSTSSSAPAAAPSASARTETDAAAKAPAVMFEVEQAGQKSWVFGTMHIGIDAEKVLPPIVFDRLDHATVVVFEANVFEISPTDVIGAATMPPGKSVKTQLAPGHWKLLVDRVGGMLMPEATLEKFRPWFLATLLAADMLPKTDPMDKVLWDRVSGTGKKIEYLETVDEQLQMIDKSLDAKVLDDMLGDLPAAEKQVTDLAAAYQAGDLVKLTTVTFDPDDMKKHPAMFDVMLFDRNARWMGKLEPLGKKGNMFVAVGAAHLLGDKGIIHRLEEAGFKTTRIER
ncbi:MAG TPA: TraB/GumN family protein [Polyangiaceae bacterium]|nr:TraB/GumN family protein [Polyangiaceae bacterium]